MAFWKDRFALIFVSLLARVSYGRLLKRWGIFNELRALTDKRGVDLISDALPFDGLWYGEPNAISNAIGYAKHRSRSHDAVIRVYDGTGNVIETHDHVGDFKNW